MVPSRRGEAPAIRTVELSSPSFENEISWVVLTATFIVLCVIYAIAFETADRGAAGGNAAKALLPYQVLFRDLPSAEQRVFRELQEGAGEVVRLRAADGDWSAVEALASQGIPPFAPDPLDPSHRAWRRERGGLVTNYVGRSPADPEAPAFLLLIVEPDPVTGERPPPPSVIDEEHQLLGKDVLLHVTFWKKRGGDVAARVVNDPAIEGWTQIRVRSPFEEMEGTWNPGS